MSSRVDRLLELVERLVEAHERQAAALERLAGGDVGERDVKPAKLPKPKRAKAATEAARQAAVQLGGGTVDELARSRARSALRRTGHR